MDSLLERTLTLLCGDWFNPANSESFRPRSMWLIEVDDVDNDEAYQWPKRVFFLNQIGMEERSVFEWKPFYAVQIARVWRWRSNWVAGPSYFVPPGQHVFEVGYGIFSENQSDATRTFDFHFGPQYGRGYAEDRQGNSLSGWIS